MAAKHNITAVVAVSFKPEGFLMEQDYKKASLILSIMSNTPLAFQFTILPLFIQWPYYVTLTYEDGKGHNVCKS